MNLFQAQIRDTFREQYKIFKDLYGLKLNYTIIKNPEDPQTYICAKRVNKSAWNTFEMIPPSPFKKQSLDHSKSFDLNNSTLGLNSSMNQTQINNNADNSFIEEDMLNKSFMTAGNTTSHNQEMPSQSDIQNESQPNFVNTLDKAETPEIILSVNQQFNF